MAAYNYDSYCGIYCGACDIMMAHKTGGKYKLASFWNEAAVGRLQMKLGLSLDKAKPYSLACHGCKSDMQFVNCAACKIRKCAIGMHVDHCGDCAKYPCTRIDELRKAGIFLPHVKDCGPNLETIKRVGTERWLREQEERWRCPDCMAGFSWYTNRCSACGKNLDKYSFRFSRFKTFILKLLMYASSGKKIKKAASSEAGGT